MDPTRDAARSLAWLSLLVERAAEDAGLSARQFRMLDYLASHGPSSASPAATELRTSKPNITALVDSLVDRGLVAREADAEDRRRISVSITSEGQKAHAAAHDAIADLLRQASGRLTVSQQQRAFLGLALWVQPPDR
jgi:DNA-binding MarR family transcriptional regulator